jgi:outer membrane protein assembly factor BamA
MIFRHKERKHSVFLLFFSLLSLHFSQTSCVRSVSSKGEHLLSGQVVKGTKRSDPEKIGGLFPQKINRKFLVPGAEMYLFFYQQGEKSYKPELIKSELKELDSVFVQKTQSLDSSSIEYQKLFKKRNKKSAKLTRKLNEGNFLMRVLGEPPTYFNEVETQKNADRIRKYLKTQGFFNVTVSYKADTVIYKRIRVTYIINEDTPFVIRSWEQDVAEYPEIDALFKQKSKESLLKIGQNFNQETRELEKVRLENLLKNQGFYYFNKSYLKIVSTYDTTSQDSAGYRFIDLKLKIAKTESPATLQSFKIGAVQFVSDGRSPYINPAKVDTVVASGIQHFFINKRYNVNLLDNRLLLRSGDFYNKLNENQSLRRLYVLDQFKYAQLQFDSVGNTLNLRYYTMPADKYQFTGEGGLSIFRYEPGPFANVSLRVRNILGGMESLELSGRVGYEAQAGFLATDNIRNVLDLGFSATLNFPEMLLPRKWRGRFADYNPRTALGLSYNYLDRQEYTRSNFRLNLNYTWQKSIYKSFQVSILDMNLVNSAFKDSQDGLDFQAYLKDLESKGNNLFRSFNQAFVSSISASYLYNDNLIGQNKSSRFLRLLFESGGTTLNFIPNHRIGLLDDIFAGTNNALQFSRFLKTEIDFRRYHPITRRSTFAWRLHGGVAWAYGGSELPYEKNFFAGGANSVRAWQPRTLGLGGLVGIVRTDGTVQYRFEQPGNIIFEGSAELRFPIAKLYGDINGAFFVDFGNVWTFKEFRGTAVDGSSKFDLSTLAVGTGLGLRYDFSYFLIRFDFGVKIYEPARPEGNRYVFKEFNILKPFSGTNPMVLNIAIGYPF